jgi:hypothetical protein
MNTLKASVNKRVITVNNTHEPLCAGSVGVDSVLITFDEEWSADSIKEYYCAFSCGTQTESVAFEVSTNEDGWVLSNAIEIPSPVLVAGSLRLTCVGYNTEGKEVLRTSFMREGVTVYESGNDMAPADYKEVENIVARVKKDFAKLEKEIPDAKTATENANVAAEKANTAAEKVDAVITGATEAVEKANTAVTNAENAVTRADEAVERADTVTASVESAEAKRVTAENARVEAETKRVSAETTRESAESKRVTAENARVTAEDKRVEEFADMMSKAHGLTVHLCVSGEYDTKTLKPTLTGDDKTLYLTPNSTSKDNDSYIEWLYINKDFERIGSTGTTIEGVSTDTIDAIADGKAQTGEQVLQTTGLSYVWSKIRSIFAPLASPALTGTPTAPTATAGTTDTQIATTAFVADAINTAITEVENGTY